MTTYRNEWPVGVPRFMTKEERSRRGRQAAQARWSRYYARKRAEDWQRLLSHVDELSEEQRAELLTVLTTTP